MARMRHARVLVTSRQQWTLRAIVVGASLYALLGAVQLAAGRWQGLVSLACAAAWLALSHLLLHTFQLRNDERRARLVTEIWGHHVDLPDCGCLACREARDEDDGLDPY